MLREVADVHQRNGEPKRRWFQSAEEDLIVWYGDDNSIVGFQLCYDRPRYERALTWWRGRGFAHDKVDDGEGSALTYKRTAILVPDGPFDATRVLERFEAAARELPPDLVHFVCAKLRQYPAGE